MIADLIVVIFLALFVYLGYKAGLVKTLFGLASYFISILLGLMLFPVVSDLFKNSFIYDAVLNFSEKQTQIDIGGNSLINEILGQLGNQASVTIASLLINIISFIAVIIVCKIILNIIYRSLKFIVKMPVISFENRILGAAAGGIKGVLLLYIIFLLINFMPLNLTSKAIDNINDSKIAYKFYKENLIIDILGKDIVK